MTTLKQIDKAIAAAVVTATKANAMFHDVAMMIFRHAAPKEVGPDCEGTGDCTRALKLVRAMPASFRRTMMVEWFRVNTPIRIKLSDNGDKCEYDPKYKKLSPEDKLAAWNLEGANTEPFYDIAERVAEDKPPLDFAALVKMVEQLSKRIEKKVEDGDVAEDDILTAKAVAAKLKGLRISRVKPEPANEQEPEDSEAEEAARA